MGFQRDEELIWVDGILYHSGSQGTKEETDE